MASVTGSIQSRSRARPLLVAALSVAIATITLLGTMAGTTVAASAPGRVTAVVGTARNASVALSWATPTSTGGSPVVGYRVRYSTNNGASWSRARATASTATSYVVTRLINGRGYVFQVRATNRVGKGSWSTPSGSVTPVAAPPSGPDPTPTAPTPTGLVQSIAVPSYFYPGSTWTQLESGAPTVGLAVINPNNGPGKALDPNYSTQVGSSQAKGIFVIGYVHTSYGRRSMAKVKADIDKHYAWYGVDGIFFDEASNNCVALAYYRKLHDYVKAKGGEATVVLNPGTRTGECFVAAGDIIVTFEDKYADYEGWQPSGWESAYPASRFWHLIINTSPANLANAIALSKSRNIGWVYVTPDMLPNPWDTLPDRSYWDQQLQLAGS